MFSFRLETSHRRLGLTPMIDVVFLLLVFFMLTAQFARDLSLPLQQGQVGAAYSGPPRLLVVGAEALWLNGSEIAEEALSDAIAALVSDMDDIIVLRGTEEAQLQRLVDVMRLLNAAGYMRLAVLE
ncbi:ExbD/TolR family protein [Aliiroseovarius sp.]|uniref:ExbD/TolR family protein n=1 Tax=Aliiroseovarius sp. TaxID=1872442 RepID=UPI003BA8CD99